MEGLRSGAQSEDNLGGGVELYCGSFEDLELGSGCLVYCDPPYAGTTGYKTGSFDHGSFFDWCRRQSLTNTVFVSEYNAPPDFIEVWRGEVKTNFSSNRTGATHNATEKLFLAP